MWKSVHLKQSSSVCIQTVLCDDVMILFNGNDESISDEGEEEKVAYVGSDKDTLMIKNSKDSGDGNGGGNDHNEK